MDEFIENFEKFRTFLNTETFNDIKDGKYQGDIWELYDAIKNKFDELELNDAF